MHLCIDCLYCTNYRSQSPGSSICNHREVVSASISPVDGSLPVPPPAPRLCLYQRGPTGMCGPTGTLFTPRPQEDLA